MSIGSGSIQGGRHLEVGGLTARERRQITLRQSHSTPQLARRDVDQHEVHGPAAKPVLGLRRRPGRQRKLMAVIATHPRATDRNLAAVEAYLAFGSAPHSVARPGMRFAGKLLGILA